MKKQTNLVATNNEPGLKRITKHLAIVFVFLVTIIPLSYSQSCLKWNIDIGGNNNTDSAGSVISVPDGFLVCGIASAGDEKFNIPAGHGNDAFIVKYNSSGNLIWKHSYGGSGSDRFSRIIATQDGGFIAAGHSFSNDGDVSGNHGSGDAWIVKTDAAGNLQWQKCFGGSRDDYALAIIADPSGYTFSGAESSRDGDFANNFGDYDAWIVKISFTGNVIWQSTYGGSRFDEAGGLTRNNDGTYIFAGATTSNNQQVGNTHGGSLDTWVVKINSSGNIIWKKVYGGSGLDYCNSMTRTTDGNLVLAHGSNSSDGDVNGTGSFVTWLLKLNSQSGDMIWSKTFSINGIDCASFGIFSTVDGGVVSLGVNGPAGDPSKADALLLAIDANGNKKWHKLLSGSNKDAALSGIEISGGSLIILSTSLSVDGDFAGGSNSSADVWITRFQNCNDNSFTKASPVNNQSNESVLYKFTNYPNPFSQSTDITYSIPQPGKVLLKIYDVMGRSIKTLVNAKVAAGIYNIQWNVNDEKGQAVPAGVYFLRMEAGDYLEAKKFSVIK